MRTRRWYEVVLEEKGVWGDDYTISKHKTLRQAEVAMEKFRLIRGGKLRIDLVERST